MVSSAAKAKVQDRSAASHLTPALYHAFPALPFFPLLRTLAGDEIVVVVKKARPVALGTPSAASAPKIRRGDVRHAVVVRTKKELQRPDGRIVRFDDNACVLLNNKKEPLGTRISGTVASELRGRGWSKILSLAGKVV